MPIQRGYSMKMAKKREMANENEVIAGVTQRKKPVIRPKYVR